jgi:hypothetical protein
MTYTQLPSRMYDVIGSQLPFELLNFFNLTVSSSSKIYCMTKGASHFVPPHENVCTCRFLITENVQTIDRKEWLCLIVWNANNPPSAAMCLSSSVIVSLVK